MSLSSTLKSLVDQSGVSTAEIRLLGFRARVLGPVDLVHALRSLYPEAPSWCGRIRMQGTTTFSIEAGAPPRGAYRIFRDGVEIWSSTRRDEVAPALEWHINNTAVHQLRSRYLFFHAGLVASANGGILMPAESGSGKTTLTAGLIANGFKYLCDEAAALDVESEQLVPFAKSLCVKQGSVQALTPLFPSLASEPPLPRLNREPVHYLHPPSGAWPRGGVPLRYVVFPRYAGAGT